MTNAVFGAKQLPPFTGEARVTIRDDAPREALKAKNVREHQVRGVFSTLNLAGGDEKNHTRCSVGNGKNGVESLAILRHLGDTEDSVHADILPFPRGRGRGWSKPCSPRRSGLTCWQLGQTRTNSATSCFMLGKEYWRATKSKVFRGPNAPEEYQCGTECGQTALCCAARRCGHGPKDVHDSTRCGSRSYQRHRNVLRKCEVKLVRVFPVVGGGSNHRATEGSGSQARSGVRGRVGNPGDVRDIQVKHANVRKPSNVTG